MKIAVGITMMVLGVILGLYVGLWLMFIGGILDIIGEVRGAWDMTVIGWGIAKIVLAGFTGGVSGMALFVPGAVMLEEGRN